MEKEFSTFLTCNCRGAWARAGIGTVHKVINNNAHDRWGPLKVPVMVSRWPHLLECLVTPLKPSEIPWVLFIGRNHRTSTPASLKINHHFSASPIWKLGSLSSATATLNLGLAEARRGVAGRKITLISLEEFLFGGKISVDS